MGLINKAKENKWEIENLKAHLYKKTQAKPN